MTRHLDGHRPLPSPAASGRRRALSANDYVEGVRSGNRAIVARAITLMESQTAAAREQAREVLGRLLPHSGAAMRVGISGVPGVGKSTFIENLGCRLGDQGHHVAVLAIDPSSSLTGGSILGDEVRMERLSRHPRAFIRPSPSRGNLGGVSGTTREAMVVCEAAGFDIVLVETIGVGQSEIAVRSMVDFFLLLLLPGGGDELQGIKKGIIELADAIVINKADASRELAQQTLSGYAAATRYLPPATPGWKTWCSLVSGRTGEGLGDLWRAVETFYQELKPKGALEARRREQRRLWLHEILQHEIARRFFEHPRVRAEIAAIEAAVVSGALPATAGADRLLSLGSPSSRPDLSP